MPTYLDASAVMKIVRDEDGSDLARTLWADADVVCGSHLVHVEVRAALAAHERNHQLTPSDMERLTLESQVLREDMVGINLTAPTADLAGALASAHALRGADAVHLASALSLDLPDLRFATWDRRLHAAALAEGLTVAPSSL